MWIKHYYAIISRINVNSSVAIDGKVYGPDGQPDEIFKQCADHLRQLKAVLFVKSLEKE